LTGIIESGDFKIDLVERTVTLHGQELQLTSEEFDVLVFRSAILNTWLHHTLCWRQVWTANRRRQTEFLRALISLRKKLDAAGPGKHYLRIEPWVIYRVDPTFSSAA
jgi:DNA-binding response OmpR family regulator